MVYNLPPLSNQCLDTGPNPHPSPNVYSDYAATAKLDGLVTMGRNTISSTGGRSATGVSGTEIHHPERRLPVQKEL